MASQPTRAGRTSGITWGKTDLFAPADVDAATFCADRRIPHTDAPVIIAMAESAYADLWSHAHSACVEVGGFLVGTAARDPATGQHCLHVVAAIPALGAIGTVTYFKLTPAAWDHISRVRESLDPDLLTVGWYHTHPGLCVFFSETDRASQVAFFPHPWSVGIVIDPADDTIAIFRGANCEPVPTTALNTIPNVAETTVDMDPMQPQAPAPLPEPATIPVVSNPLAARRTLSRIAAVGAAAGIAAGFAALIYRRLAARNRT